MYESPITAMISDITTEMQQEQDREIMNAILSVGISVDKDELVKALSYDRQQYGKGYAEGYAAAQADTPRWISVEERLPEKHVEVLICTEDYGKNELGFANIAVWDGSEWIETWNRKESIPYVSHWMPLPAPPKEGRP